MPRATACATKKLPRKFGIENQIPIFPGDFQSGFANVAASIVDEDVDVAEMFSAAATICLMLS